MQRFRWPKWLTAPEGLALDDERWVLTIDDVRPTRESFEAAVKAATDAQVERVGMLSLPPGTALLADGMLHDIDGVFQMRTVLRADLRPDLPQATLDAIVAAADPTTVELPAGEIAWTSDAIMFVDTPTDDGRDYASAGLGHRDLPLPFMTMDHQPEGASDPHGGAFASGRVDSITLGQFPRVPAAGVFLDSDEGRRAAALAAAGAVTGVSVDLAVFEYDLEYVTEEVIDGGETFEVVTDVIFHGLRQDIIGATQTPHPAFGQARIAIAPSEDTAAEPVAASAVIVGDVLPQPVVVGDVPDIPWTPPTPQQSDTLLRTWAGSGTASGHLWLGQGDGPRPWFGPLLASAEASHPDRSAFDLPTERVPWTVDGDRVYGYLAFWTEEDGHTPMCHIGYSDQCVCPPKSKTGYARFLQHDLQTTGGSVPVGPVCLRGGHADGYQTEAEARAHYDNTDSIAAWVTIGENAHGIACAGVVQPDLSEGDRLKLAACQPSGDWRPYQTSHELVAVSMVPVPGFPQAFAAAGVPQVPRPRLWVDDGEVRSLVAAGAAAPARLLVAKLAAERPVTRGEMDALASRLDRMEEVVRDAAAVAATLEPDARARLLEVLAR